MPSSARRFPPPWTAELQPNHYVVRDANGQQLAYVYYESEPGRRSAAKLLTKDEARRVAANIAKLPSLLRREKRMTDDPTPSDLLKAKIKEFYFAVGVAMVRWQDVEFEMTELFYTLVGGNHAIVSAVFNTVPSFPTKVRMVKVAARLRLANTDLLKPCNDLCKCLNDDEGVQRKRNQIAHYMMYHDPPEGENLDPKAFADKYAFYLGPQMFDAQQRRTQLKTTDIENRTKEFGEAAKRIRDFTAQVKAARAAT